LLLVALAAKAGDGTVEENVLAAEEFRKRRMVYIAYKSETE
jgi:hypothetical protein